MLVSPLSCALLFSPPRHSWWAWDKKREWPVSEITPQLRNQRHFPAALCCTLLTGRKPRGTSLTSHCSLLRDTGAVTVRLSWPGSWQAGRSFSQTPSAFQSGKREKYFHKRPTSNFRGGTKHLHLLWERAVLWLNRIKTLKCHKQGGSLDGFMAVRFKMQFHSQNPWIHTHVTITYIC